MGYTSSHPQNNLPILKFYQNIAYKYRHWLSEVNKYETVIPTTMIDGQEVPLNLQSNYSIRMRPNPGNPTSNVSVLREAESLLMRQILETITASTYHDSYLHYRDYYEREVPPTANHILIPDPDTLCYPDALGRWWYTIWEGWSDPQEPWKHYRSDYRDYFTKLVDNEEETNGLRANAEAYNRWGETLPFGIDEVIISGSPDLPIITFFILSDTQFEATDERLRKNLGSAVKYLGQYSYYKRTLLNYRRDIDKSEIDPITGKIIWSYSDWISHGSKFYWQSVDPGTYETKKHYWLVGTFGHEYYNKNESIYNLPINALMDIMDVAGEPSD